MRIFAIALAIATLAAGYADASEHKGFTEAQCTASIGHRWQAGYSYDRTLKSGEIRVITVRDHCRSRPARKAPTKVAIELAN